MILPLFDYGDIFYDSCPNKYKNKLDTIQNKAIRIIKNLPSRENTNNAMEELKLHTLSHRRAEHILSLSFTEIKQPKNRDINRNTRYNAAGRHNFKMFTPHTTKIQNSITYKLRKYWNNLPTEAHNINEISAFKRYLYKNQLL